MNKIIFLEGTIINLDFIIYIQIWEFNDSFYCFKIKYKPLGEVIHSDEFIGKYKTRDEIETAFEEAKKTIQ